MGNNAYHKKDELEFFPTQDWVKEALYSMMSGKEMEILDPCCGDGGLEYFGVLSGVPILQFGIPAVFSIYFDLFSGFVQAFVFTLLCMVYIAGACPPPEENNQ